MKKAINPTYFKDFFIIFCSSFYSIFVLKYFDKLHSGFIIVMSLLLFLGIKTVLKHKVFKDRFLALWTTIFSLLLSIILILGNKIVFCGDVFGTFKYNYVESINLIDIIMLPFLSVSISIFLLCIFYLTNNIHKYKYYNHIISGNPSKKIIVIFSSITFLCWLPHTLVCYPGCVLSDSFDSIYQALEMRKLSNHHPILFTLLVKAFIKLSFLFEKDITFGIFLFVIFQMLVMSVVLGYSMYWMLKHKYNFYFVCFSLIYFSLSPVFAIYAFNVQKDSLFSLSCFAMIPLLISIVESNGTLLSKNKSIFLFFTICFFIAFLRSNGILVVLGIILAICILFYKQVKKFVPCSIAFIIMFFIITGPIYSKFGIEKPAVEAMSFPLQQMSSVVVYDGSMTQEEKEFMNSLLPIDSYKEIYAPCLVDTIKWNENFNTPFLYENKKLFIKTWIKMFPNNYKEYIKAALMENFGFWKIGVKNRYGFIDTTVDKNCLNIKSADLPASTFNINIKNFLIKTDFFGSGTLALIMLISIFLIFVNKKYKHILSLLPCFIPWATMIIATPVAFSLRYIFVLAIALPFIVSLPFYTTKNKDVNKYDNTKSKKYSS